MSDFEKWFAEQEFYTNMRFIHGDALFAKDGDVYRVLPVQMTYQAWQTARYKTKDERIALTQEWHTKGWNARQEEIDQLKAEKEKLEIELSETKQVYRNVVDMELAKVEKLKAEKAGLEKRVDEVLEHLDGESSNHWGPWKEKADMMDQGASNAFEEAYWIVKKALRGGHE